MKKIFTLIAMLACTLGMQATEVTWTIAGDKALMGVHWDPASADNLMSGDGATLTLVKTDVMLKAGNYDYKACQNSGWDKTVPQEGNQTLAIEADGAYKVTFTLAEANTESPILAAIAEKTGEYVGPTETVWVVAGAKDLLGVEWAGGSEDNKMTSSDGKVFTLVKTDVALDKETPYQYKYVQDESGWYGNLDGVVSKENGNKNFELFVDEPGVYTVTFTLDTENWTSNVVATKTGEATFGEKTWTICGQAALCGNDWDPTYEANDMEKVEEGYYELTRTSVELEAKTYEYKVAANHSWGESYGSEITSNGNQVLTVSENGTYDVTFSFIVSTKTLEAEYETTGITAVSVKAVPSTPMFNLQGQRVTSSYRGIAVKNGKKMIVK